ncbi:RNA polymerase sigma factor [Mucilaginibacter auburnensis]|uniref:DNA-directed RNA polymerase specialized sigma24 family protein n=1 Tax=Mucilaginibacter auburnensis TaxID=1457233 RepID=A0A2H9VP40_9SPHI|nr:sigma-70 family RNA polymerase sigma factor [Mucilaginibacter auburnensis]PJJ80073.1 DNA-directed RNA polymerase specialized sigma24 family protein [Mucilaginibacter auburnensis]
MNNSLLTTQSREVFFVALYKKTFPAVARYVARRGGSLDEARDIFQDALVLYYEKVMASSGDAILNEKGFLMGVSKKLWLQRYQANGKNEALYNVDIETEDSEALSTYKILNYLKTAGEKCMQLLKACYYDGLKPDNVAAEFGYSSTHSATVAKYKCLEKVRETVKQNSLSYADFTE